MIRAADSATRTWYRVDWSLDERSMFVSDEQRDFVGAVGLIVDDSLQSAVRRSPLVERVEQIAGAREQGVVHRKRSYSQDTAGTLDDVATAANIGTIALADQLNHLRARVLLTEADVARATGADEAVARQWIVRAEAPMGVHANRLAELMAVVEEMALNVKPESIPEWLTTPVEALSGEVPADVIATGGYQRVMDIALWLSTGGFT